jgi:hypothetical protein
MNWASGMLVRSQTPRKSPFRRGPIGRQGRWIRVRADRPFGARQTGGSHNARVTPYAPLRQPGAVLPLRGAVAPVAPTCANAGQFW